MLFVAKKKSGFLQVNLSVYTSDITSKCAKGKLFGKKRKTTFWQDIPFTTSILQLHSYK